MNTLVLWFYQKILLGLITVHGRRSIMSDIEVIIPGYCLERLLIKPSAGATVKLLHRDRLCFKLGMGFEFVYYRPWKIHIKPFSPINSEFASASVVKHRTTSVDCKSRSYSSMVKTSSLCHSVSFRT